MFIVACPSCGGNSYESLGILNGIALEKCACSLVRQRLTAEEIDGVEDREKALYGHEWVLNRRSVGWIFRHQARQRVRLMKKYRTSGRILEVGCGTGEFLVAARNAGFDSTGVELSKPTADYVRLSCGIPVHCGTLEEFHPDKGFDVIALFHVLEHMKDPYTLLQQAIKLASPDAIFLITVPNIESWSVKFLPRSWGVMYKDHLYYFSRTTLSGLLRRVGLKCLKAFSYEVKEGWFYNVFENFYGDRVRSFVWGLKSRAQANVPTSPVAPLPSPQAGVYPRDWDLLRKGFVWAAVLSGYPTFPLRYLQGKVGGGSEVTVVAQNDGGMPAIGKAPLDMDGGK